MTLYQEVSWQLAEASRWIQKAKKLLQEASDEFTIHEIVNIQCKIGFADSDLAKAEALLKGVS